MRVLGNILWHVFGFGWLIAFIVWLIGAAFTLLVVTAPIGLGLIQFANFLLAPCSRNMIDDPELIANSKKNIAWKTYGFIMSIIYGVCIGAWISILLLILTALFTITIIGIPIAYVLAKSTITAFNPVNKKCVDHEIYEELKRREAIEKVNKMLGDH